MTLPRHASEMLVADIVHRFYEAVRGDPLLAPVFALRLGADWDAHLGKMVDFWSSLTLQSGRYSGQPHVAHRNLGLTVAHFERWLALFRETVEASCTGPVAALFLDRAHRVAESLQIGLDIGP